MGVTIADFGKCFVELTKKVKDIYGKNIRIWDFPAPFDGMRLVYISIYLWVGDAPTRKASRRRNNVLLAPFLIQIILPIIPVMRFWKWSQPGA